MSAEHELHAEYVVRELREADLEPKQGFYETLRNLSDSPDLSHADSHKVLKRIHEQGSHIFVAVTPSGEIVGTTTLLIEQKLSHGGALAGHIEDVSTRQGWERKGIGRAVMEAAIAKAREQGCYKVILDCSEHNVPFYEKFHFKKHGHCMRLTFE